MNGGKIDLSHHTRHRSDQECKASGRNPKRKEGKLVTMGRRAKTQRLNVWMNGIPVGYRETARQGERLAYLIAHLPGSRYRATPITIDVSLPWLGNDGKSVTIRRIS
jgi:hypothetical protein